MKIMTVIFKLKLIQVTYIAFIYNGISIRASLIHMLIKEH